MLSTVEDKIINYLMLNMEDLQGYVNKYSDSAPPSILYDIVIHRIEKDTDCAYSEIIEYFDEPVFNKMFMLGGSNVKN